MKIGNTYNIFLLLLLFFGATMGTALGQQDIVMRGSVVLQNSKTLTGKVTYLPDVNIRSLKTTPTMSDSRGQFKLVFANVNYGAKTELTARKTGMMVVNQEILKEAAIVGRADTLKVVMCDEAQFEDNKQRFYSISTENLQRELSRRVAKLQRANAADKRRLMDSLQNEMSIKLTSSDEAIAQLNTRSKALEEQLEKLSNDFAAVNLDDASETYRLAYRAFTEGDIHKSLGILYAVDLRKRLADNKLQIKRRDTLIATMARQNDTSTLQISQDIQACLLAANNHKILFQHREAQSWYETAIDFADTTNLALLNDYTEYLYEFGEFEKATKFNKIALQRAQNLRQTVDSTLYTEGYAVALFHRASLLSRQAIDFVAIQNVCLEALPLFEQLSQTDTLKRLMMGRLVSDLAQSYSFEKQDSLAIIWYNQALSILQLPVLSRAQSQAMLYKSIAHLGLGNTYRRMKNLSLAESQYLISVGIRRHLSSVDSFRYAPFTGLSLTTLAEVYISKKEFTKAIDTLKKAITYHNITLATNPLYSQREILRTEITIADAYLKKQQYDSSESILMRLRISVEEMSRQQSEKWVSNIREDIVRVWCNLVSEYARQRDFTNAHQKSLSIYQFSPNDNTARATLAVSHILINDYQSALNVIQPIRTKKTLIKNVLEFYNRKNVSHPDFERLKIELGL